MVAYNPKDWFGLIFKFHKSDTFRRLLPLLTAVAAYSALLAWIEIDILKLNFRSTSALHSILGFVVSILLVFRTNTAYDRWWEGRRLWGQLVNNSRNLVSKIIALNPNPAQRELLLGHIAQFPQLLMMHLRDEKNPEMDEASHQPNLHLLEMQRVLFNTFNAQELLLMNEEISGYHNILGACERIKKTPIPFAYSMFLKKFIFAYVLTMPYGFINEFGYGVTAVVTFTCYVLTSMELIAEDIENPFGYDANDLPLDQICENIRTNIAELSQTKAN